jgi:hypothetical protein
MKYTFITVLVFLSFSNTWAQQDDSKFQHTLRGSHLAGGTISLNNSFSNYSNGSNSHQFTANLNPNYGFFVRDKFAIGGVLSAVYSKAKDFQATTLVGLSPFVRYYYGAPKSIMTFSYASAGGGIQNNNNESSGFYSFEVGQGLDFFANEHVAFDGLLTYRGSHVDASNSVFNHNIGLLIGLQIFF